MLYKDNLSAFGSELRSKRTEMNISCNDVSQKLKIKESYIHAIESGKISDVPSVAYFLGYAKAYSEFLRVDNYEAIKSLLNPMNENFKLTPQEITSNNALIPSTLTLSLSIILCAGIILVSYLIF
jgi:cytoskeletal protein RodZ